MKHYLGLDEEKYHMNPRVELPVNYDPVSLLNGHMLITGISGSGKSFQSMRLLSSAAESGLEIDIFDIHEELHHVLRAKTAKISQYTRYGYNPMILDTDPHTGGPARQADFIIGLVKSVTPSLGDLQVNVLRNLILDTYADKRIFQNDVESWPRKIITEDEREAQRGVSRLLGYYPTLEDLLEYARRKLQILMLGANNSSFLAFETLTAEIKKLFKAQDNYGRKSDPEEIAKLEAKIEVLRGKAVELYEEALAAMTSGKEFEDMLKYGSTAMLASIINRIESLNSAGIFRATPPPFGNAQVKVHQIQALTQEQRMLYVKLRLRSIFDSAVARGRTKSGTELRQIIFIDEAQNFFTDEEDDIINIIAREARKFGLGLWMASQSPLGFPESFIRNVGATMLLGISSLDWSACMRALRMTEAMLQKIKPKELMLVKLQREGESNPQFRGIYLPHAKGALPARIANSHDPRPQKMAAAQ